MTAISSQFTAIASLGSSIVTGNKVTVTPGLEQTIVNEVVPSAKDWFIYKVQIDCRFEGFFEIFKDSLQIGSGRTGPASPNVEYLFPPAYQLLVGEAFVIKFTSRIGTPNTSDVGAWVHYIEKDA